MSEWVLLGIGLLLTVGTGFFVASEFALVNLDRSDLEARRDRGEQKLTRTIGALRHTSTHLSSAQLGITLTTLLAGYTLEPGISRLLADPFISWGVSEDAIGPISSVVAIVIATLISMVIGELVPKNFALALPLATAKVVVPFQTAFTAIFRPAVQVLNGSANGVLRSVGIEPKEELSGARTAEELSSLLRRSAGAGTLEEDTATLLDRTLRFSAHDASDVMTPRLRVVAASRTDPAQAVLDLARETGFSRFPVIDTDIDDIVGIVHLKHAVGVPRERRADVPVSALQVDVLRVPETMPLDFLLGELRGRGLQMAVVVDEYGGTAGVATLEDLVEEIVGEVSDEHDRTSAGVVNSVEGVLFPGSLRPDELRERTGILVPEEGPYETVAGYLMAMLGRVPAIGDEYAAEHGTFRVERMDGHRIDRIRFRSTERLESDAAATGDSETVAPAVSDAENSAPRTGVTLIPEAITRPNDDPTDREVQR
ncbi:CBS domain containing-hemolysin-like protein [Mycetocola sp. BIGb0189]|uniref:hemolysin family protein n=1 Tax=Mycetocola sp. BIGb0189 TaxID=2940604 RepID=UPI002166CD99|nr:hemolysin family protein [Mycetocola sp. BIGb0189]MCS4276666.1 CBS domain containing-hemolysin-like protein [Mycetocola sp. BIGb0189]